MSSGKFIFHDRNNEECPSALCPAVYLDEQQAGVCHLPLVGGGPAAGGAGGAGRGGGEAPLDGAPPGLGLVPGGGRGRQLHGQGRSCCGLTGHLAAASTATEPPPLQPAASWSLVRQSAAESGF